MSTLEINCDAVVSRSGSYVKRPMNVLRMFSNTSINIPNLTATNLTYTTVDTAESCGDTGFTYANGAFTNNTSSTIVVYCSYGITYTSNSTGSRVSWIATSQGASRYGQVAFAGSTYEPSVTGSGIIPVPAGGILKVWCYTNAGLTLQAVSMGYNSLFFQIVVI